MKHFLITIDTESDNQWSETSQLTTKNAAYIYRFQELCEKYEFKPVYLTDYSMASDDYYCGYMKEKLQDGLCEVGMHLHAWDTPPWHSLDGARNKPYLIEYPDDIMAEKIKTITQKLEDVFKVKVSSHRAGRWAMDERYAQLLIDNGYTVDCSVTPGVSWAKQTGGISGGSNYLRSEKHPYFWDNQKRLLEIPMTVRRLHIRNGRNTGGWKGKAHQLKDRALGRNIWLRPSICSEQEIYALLRHMKQEESDYLEFMMHSSEFMPGGSPYYTTQHEIDDMFALLDRIYSIIKTEYQGCTLKEYGHIYTENRLRGTT